MPRDRMLQPIKLAICSCVGIDPDNVKLLDSEEFVYQVQVGNLKVDTLISRIRREITDSNSVLNSLPITRRVFSQAKLSIYIGSNPNSLPIELMAPDNAEFQEDDPLPMTSKLSLPPNSTHSPIRVVFVDGSAQSKLDQSDLDRSFLIQLPAQLVDEDSSADIPIIAEIDELLARPQPTIPESFSNLKKLFVN